MPFCIEKSIFSLNIVTGYKVFIGFIILQKLVFHANFQLAYVRHTEPLPQKGTRMWQGLAQIMLVRSVAHNQMKHDSSTHLAQIWTE